MHSVYRNPFAHAVRFCVCLLRGLSLSRADTAAPWQIILAASLAVHSVQAADAMPSSAQDLQYGEVLYYYYQDDWFNSIVRTHIAQTQERLPNHARDAELLLGGLDLNYGLRRAADDIFQRLLTDETADEQTRNRAWYYLAKISYQRGDMRRALQALARVQGDMSRGTRMETAHLASLVLLQAGENEQAGEILQEARNRKVWSPYLAYNLAVAMVRGTRQADGFRQLDQIGAMNSRNEEYRLLRDKANLALGYSLLQAGQPAASREALNRVRLQGPLSGKALLGAGWADAEIEAYGQALVPWLELSKRDTTDPAVQEALLAVPYAMTRMELHGRAIEQYNNAIATLFSEQDHLKESIAAISRGELLEVLQNQDLRSGTGWLQDLDLETEHPALRYQVTLLAAHEFQEAVKNYRDLLILRNNLMNWSEAIEAYGHMLDGRKRRYAQHKPDAQAALKATDRSALQARYRDLTARLEGIEADNDPTGLANAEEARQWQKLRAIRQRLATLPASPEIDALRDKQRRLEGILYWQLNDDYKPRLWTARQQLASLAGLLEQTTANLASLQTSDRTTPAGFTDFAGRINQGRARISELLERTATTFVAQGKLVEQIAVSELQKQQQRIDTYIVQARFALAQTYDSALLADRGSTP